MNKWVLTLSAALALSSSVAMAADVAAGKTTSAICAACHQADGNSINPIWPNLAGQHASYIEKQLMDFRAGARTDPSMAPMAMAITEADVPNVAAYFASQTPKGGEAAADKVALGEKVYRTGNAANGVAACVGCHGPSGKGNPTAKYPRISGQHAAYLEKALKDFRSGTRTNDPNNMMRGVAAKLTDAEIEAVAQYIQGLN